MADFFRIVADNQIGVGDGLPSLPNLTFPPLSDDPQTRGDLFHDLNATSLSCS